MIHPSPTRPRPFENLVNTSDDHARLLKAEYDAPPVLLNDWTHDLSDTIYSRYFETGAFPNCVDSLLANGLGRVECLPDYILKAGTGLGLDSTSGGGSMSSQMSPMSSSMSIMGMRKRMDMGASSMFADTMMNGVSSTDAPIMTTLSSAMTSSMAPMPMALTSPMTSSMAPLSSMAAMSGTQGMASLNALGCTPPMMFKPGYNITSLPPVTCANTTSKLLTISANQTQGWLALNLVNSGSVSKLAVSLDTHSLYVYAADGLYVTLQEVKVSHKP